MAINTSVKHILTAGQFNKEDLENILQRTEVMEKECKSGEVKKLLTNKIVACIFFEPSTRTRLSFSAAALKLGAQIISAENAALDFSVHKGESIEDTARMILSYADLMVMRHPRAGSVSLAAEVAKKPVINAGDGGNEHPTQAVLDLYTIKKRLGRLDDLNIAFGFDPKHSRTIRSLALLLTHYKNNRFTFVCSEALAPLPEFLKDLEKRGARFEVISNLDRWQDYDIFYANRLQEERFKDKNEFEKYRRDFVITRKLVEGSKTMILDPLPRIDEIELGVDALPNALYFDQAQNGLYVRMALLLYSMGM